ncbi:MAG: serine/threonine protein kinase [Alphaproteobacteria bacterium]|nr:serine/threonine protein kinase [Alphaproteobacteria bacterium]
MDRPIGRGAQGEVWSAWDTLREAEVAMKRAAPGTPARLSRQELVALRLLDLPGVVRLLDSGTWEGRPFLVMERLRGQSWADRARPCPWEAIREAVGSLLRTLQALHEHRVYHRDLKPSHVIEERIGEVVLLDFGVASGLGVHERGAPAGGQIGDPAYAAPEQSRSPGLADGRSDLYAVGVMLYELLSGEHPAQARDDGGGLIPLRTRVPEVPEHVAALVEHALARRQSMRPDSAASALQALGLSLAPRLERELASWPARRVESAELAEVFAGPERVFGLRSAASEVARLRAGESGERLSEELSDWIGRGLARWQRGALAVEPGGLELLRWAPPRARPTGAPGECADAEALTLAHHLWPMATLERLEGALGESTLERVETLVTSGWLRWMDAQRLEAVRLPHRADVPKDVARALARRALAALPLGSPARLRLQLLTGSLQDAIEELLSVAERAESEGRLGEAARLLDEALRLCGGDVPLKRLSVALSRRAQAALQLGALRDIELGLYALERMEDVAPSVRPLIVLLDAARRLRRGETGPAQEGLTLLTPFDEEALDRWRWVLQVEVAQFESGTETLARVLEGATDWVIRWGTPTAEADLSTWRGLLAYRRGDMALAARLHTQGAAAKRSVTSRLGGQVNAASALMEAGALEQAEEAACRLRDAARLAQQPRYAARAEWLLRSVRYRAGLAETVDWELADLAPRLAGFVGGQLLVVEASVAWRAGRFADARRLTHRLRDVWAAQRDPVLRWLVDVLGLAFAPTVDTAKAEALLLRGACIEPPGFALQGMGLLLWAAPRLREAHQARVLAVAARVPLMFTAGRRELMTLQEVTQGVHTPPPRANAG